MIIQSEFRTQVRANAQLARGERRYFDALSLKAAIVWVIINIRSNRYITPQIEKVIPAGTKRFGYMSDSSPVVKPFIGRAFARPFIVIIAVNNSRLIMIEAFFIVFL